MIFEILRISIDGAVDNHGILLEGEITRPENIPTDMWEQIKKDVEQAKKFFGL